MMQLYRQGSSGEAVKKIQTAVSLKADGIFGPQTRAAVIAFQQSKRLNADGIVGPITWKALIGSDLPEPDRPSVFYQSQCKYLFGDPHESSFARAWITTVQIHRWKFETHKWMVEPLKKAVANLNAAGLIQDWKTYDGCWNVRYMKGGNSLSIHSWGLAIDINAAENPFNSGDFAMSDQFAQCFKDAGLHWGGDWISPVDAMHFQLPRVG